MAITLPQTGNVLLDKALGIIQAAFNKLLTVALTRDHSVGVTFTAANTDTLVPHGLKAVPRGYLPVRVPSAGTVYSGSAVAAPYTADAYVNLKWSGSVPATLTLVFF